MILGEDPTKVAEVPKKKSSRRQPAGGVRGVIAMYFLYHPKVKMHQVFSSDDREILFIGISHLVDDGISERDAKRMIDAFYETTQGTVARPVLTFLTKHMQRTLREGLGTHTPAHYKMWKRDHPNGHSRLYEAFAATNEVIDEFIANNFSAEPEAKLPWDRFYDTEIRRRCIAAGNTNPYEIIGEYVWA